ncbi:MAG: spore germination protein [Bacilli bacterium]|nr:spore germination protein [Bacilli bacterium]
MNKNLNAMLLKIKNDLHNSSDLHIRTLDVKNHKLAYLFMESVSSSNTISDFIVRSITFENKLTKGNFFDNFFKQLQNTIVNSTLTTTEDYEYILYLLAAGFTIILIDGYTKAISLETRKDLSRGVTESSSEGIIRGPKDSFTETHATNLGLVRKRIKDPNLVIEDAIVGRRTKTKVSLLYISDVADLNKVKQIKNKLDKIDVDGILDSGHIREFLITKQKSVFPKMISTERPDVVCSSLLNGKIAIIVENTPYALVIPALFIDFFHSAEDYYQSPSNVTLTRILRSVAFLLTLFVPALYISIMTFNSSILPEQLLVTLYHQRLSVPFPTSFEIILLLIIFEILRECDIRTPSAMGTSMSIVGGLVLGDAAVSAGIVSPISVIVVAITSISGLLFTDIDMINGIRFWRILFIIFSTFFGIIGFSLCLILLVTKLSHLKVMGTSYLSPISPLNITGLKDSLIRIPKNKDTKRPAYLSQKNIHKLGGKK